MPRRLPPKGIIMICSFGYYLLACLSLPLFLKLIRINVIIKVY